MTAARELRRWTEYDERQWRMGSPCRSGRRFGFESEVDHESLGPLPGQILNVVEGHVQHVADDEHGAGVLDDGKRADADRFAPDRLNQRQENVAAVQDRDREEVEQRQIDIQDHAEPDRLAPAMFALKEQIVYPHDADR